MRASSWPEALAKGLLIGVLSAALVFGGPFGPGSLFPQMAIAQTPQPSQPPAQAGLPPEAQQVGQWLAQHARVIWPGDPQFALLHARWTQLVGAQGLAPQGLQAQPTGQPIALGSATFTPFAEAAQLNLSQLAQQGRAVLLGTLQLPAGAQLQGHPLPQQLVLGAMPGSLVIVILDPSAGTVIAFIWLPSFVLLWWPFFPPIYCVYLILYWVFLVVPGPGPGPGPWPWPWWPWPLPAPGLGCPALPSNVPGTVSVGSGATLISLTGAFALREGGLDFMGRPTILVQSLGPSLTFSSVSAGFVQWGAVGGSSTGRAKLPTSGPFRLLVQGGGKTACLQGTVSGWFFPAMITGTLYHN